MDGWFIHGWSYMYLQHNYIHVHEDTCTHTHTHRQRLCQMHVHVHVYALWKNVHKIHQPNKSEANSEPRTCTSILQLHCFYPHRNIDSVRYTQCIYISGLQKEVKSFQGAGQTPTFDPLKETLMSTKFFLTYTTYTLLMLHHDTLIHVHVHVHLRTCIYMVDCSVGVHATRHYMAGHVYNTSMETPLALHIINT